ncbi:MAG: sulfur carrier protein ThiS [Terriglobales bacterium]
MQLTVNGQRREAAADLNLLDLLRELGLPAERLAIERNHQLVPKREWPTTQLAAGDQIEIVHFVGGG